ncbi:MAG: cysteine desulfurase [Rhodospirillales bacterium]
MTAAPARIGDNAVQAFDAAKIRADFPILTREVHGQPLVYLDSGASAQKPQAVIDAMSGMMESTYANVHRGVHWLSQTATEEYENARRVTQTFLNARSENEIVLAKSATQAMNLVATCFSRAFMREGDEVIISAMEHHANIVPWQMLRDRMGVVLKIAPIHDSGELDMAAFENLLSDKTKLVAVTHVSNVLGTVVPIKQVIEKAHAAGAKVLVDGCQAAPHTTVDVQALDADFYVFAPHKTYGPTGVGVLYGKEDLLNAMPPYEGGGDMIASVSFEETTYQQAPVRFEAGTPAIVEAAGLAAALNYMQGVGLDAIAAHEHALLAYATDKLSAIDGVTIYGAAKEKSAIVSFNMQGVHAHDIGTIVDRAGVAIRVGHHCAQPLMTRYGVAAMARASFGMYNTREDIDQLAEALGVVKELFG